MLAKRVFIGFSVFFVFLLVLWGVYALFLSVPDTADQGAGNEPAQDESAMDTKGEDAFPKIEAVATNQVVSPGLSGDGKTIYFIEKDTGYIFRYDTETKTKEVAVDYDLPGVITASWPGRGTEVIVKSEGATGPVFRLFDVRSQEPIQLKDGLQYVVWDALSDRIIYSYSDKDGNTTLNTAGSGGQDWKSIAKLPSSSVRLATVPQSPLVSYWYPPLNTRLTPLTTISLSNGEEKTIFAGKYGADYLWSPRGDRALMSWVPEKNGSRLALATINSNGGNYTDLNFPTMVSKCVWSKDNVTVYCAHPGTFPSGTVLPEDYDRKHVYTTDAFWKINTQTGEQERIVELQNINQEYDAADLFLSGNESKLFFVNRRDDILYSIEL